MLLQEFFAILTHVEQTFGQALSYSSTRLLRKFKTPAYYRHKFKTLTKSNHDDSQETQSEQHALHVSIIGLRPKR